jgi:DNA-binding NarL/FixJ family response regulator
MLWDLTEKEKEILSFLNKGLLNKEIASVKSISLDTVKKHNKNIFRKMNVRNRIEAIILFQQYQLNQFNK